MANSPKSRSEWIESCEFHPLTNTEVLLQVHARIDHEIKSQKQPVLLLDLDSTLYHVESRSHQIIREWIDDPESRGHPEFRERLTRLLPEHLGYSLTDTLGKFGISVMDPGVEAALHSMQKFWGRRFFTNEYLAYDRAYPGAPEFVSRAHAAGAEIVYLTGRDEPGMGNGTRARLRGDGFPFERPRTRLLLKENFELDDLEHKSRAADLVKKLGSLVASFENEAPNLVALCDLFPAAMHVFMDTVMSSKPAFPRTGLYRITGFQ
jgi:hypothetical protein